MKTVIRKIVILIFLFVSVGAFNMAAQNSSEKFPVDISISNYDNLHSGGRHGFDVYIYKGENTNGTQVYWGQAYQMAPNESRDLGRIYLERGTYTITADCNGSYRPLIMTVYIGNEGNVDGILNIEYDGYSFYDSDYQEG